MKHLKITTEELAKICGVSQGTVDRALNDRADIKKETKEKILNVAKLYGYRKYISGSPNTYKGLIGIIVFDLNNEYFSELIMNIESIARSFDLGTIVMLTHYDKSSEIECIANMYNMGVKGIILCSVNGGDEFNEYLKMIDIPIVAVGNDIGGIPYVGIDDFAAMKDMTNKMLSKGYENVIYFSPALKYENAHAQIQRFKGFKEAVKDRHCKIVTDIDDIDESYNEKTVIICSNDYYAFSVYSKTKNTKITGFDNLKAIKKYKIAIDSVGYSVSDVAQTAVDIILSEKNVGKICKHYLTENS